MRALLRVRPLAGCVAAAAVLASGSGCMVPLAAVTASAGMIQAGGTAYITGELESAEVIEMHVLYEIVQEVLAEEFAFEITVARTGENYAFIHARETQGRVIRVNLERKSPIVSKINIRIGLLGDHPTSRLILGGIQSRIPAPPHRHPALDEVLRVLDESGNPRQ